MKTLIAIAYLTCIVPFAIAQMPAKIHKLENTKKEHRVRLPINPQDRAAKKAKAEERMMKEYGGVMPKPNTQEGEIFFVNCQKRVPKGWIDELVTYTSDETHFKISYTEGSFDFPAPKIQGNATLYIIDEEKMPVILHAPESRWAMVNVAEIAKERRAAFFQARTKKQLARTFALLCGASNSQYPGALTRGIINEEDLDKNIDYVLPVDIFKRMRTYMESHGVKPQTFTTYETACEEGWAHNPTNQYQQAAWNRVHAEKERGPANAIQIKP